MKKLGFGCMRLPMMGGADGEVDKREFCRMVDTFLAEGFCYFDTAHGYLNGKSETALRECLTARYPRESYILTDKLTSFFFEKEDDILPLFEQQLEKTGVSYFDYYLLHALNGAYYEKFTRCNAFEIVKQLKEQGRVKHIGISPSVMVEEILPGEGIRYTASIHAGNRLKDGEVTFRVAVADENGVICDSQEFTLPTQR